MRQLSITRGTIGLKIPSFIGSDSLISDAIKFAKEDGFIDDGDAIVAILAQNEQTPDYTNILKIANV